MLASQPHERYPNAESILQALNSTSTPFVPPAPQPYSPPPAQPTYQQPPAYQPPPVAPTPPAYQAPAPTPAPAPAPTYQSSSNSVAKSSGLKDWHKVILIGSGVGLIILLCIIFIKPLIFPVSEEDIAPVAETVKPDEVKPEPPPKPVFSEQNAVDLLNNWQNAKRKIFAYPFDLQLLRRYQTDKKYQDNIGSVNWLRNNNAYYRYGVQSIDSVKEFFVSGNRATIDVVVTEQRTFYMNNRVVNDGNTAFDTRLVRYNLVEENGQWKIEDYNTVKKIKVR